MKSIHDPPVRSPAVPAVASMSLTGIPFNGTIPFARRRFIRSGRDAK
jgi:hypothetical protein